MGHCFRLWSRLELLVAFPCYWDARYSEKSDLLCWLLFISNSGLNRLETLYSTFSFYWLWSGLCCRSSFNLHNCGRRFQSWHWQSPALAEFRELCQSLMYSVLLPRYVAHIALTHNEIGIQINQISRAPNYIVQPFRAFNSSIIILDTNDHRACLNCRFVILLFQMQWSMWYFTFSIPMVMVC